MPQVADYVLSRLSEWGIHRIYGYPGDGINGFLGALDRVHGDPEIIQPRHEEMGKTDQEIPPIPPHIKKELGKKSAKAMLKGDPEEVGVIAEGAEGFMHEFRESIKEALPGKRGNQWPRERRPDRPHGDRPLGRWRGPIRC